MAEKSFCPGRDVAQVGHAQAGIDVDGRAGEEGVVSNHGVQPGIDECRHAVPQGPVEGVVLNQPGRTVAPLHAGERSTDGVVGDVETIDHGAAHTVRGTVHDVVADTREAGAVDDQPVELRLECVVVHVDVGAVAGSDAGVRAEKSIVVDLHVDAVHGDARV
ncbi:MAG: hypothetical protein L0Z51_08200 [Candidatus Latescibacteria bacterium]|nr:hypothetical protein [Candidatus Latescibacterota bacterium]